MTQICNLSIKLSHFPNNCKLAKPKPLYKKAKTDPKIFRPISLLLIISKVMEKMIQDQTMKYLTDNNILYRYQSRFCKNHSTDTCLLYVKDKILTDFSSGILTGALAIDLKRVKHNKPQYFIEKKYLPLDSQFTQLLFIKKISSQY